MNWFRTPLCGSTGNPRGTNDPHPSHSGRSRNRRRGAGGAVAWEDKCMSKAHLRIVAKKVSETTVELSINGHGPSYLYDSEWKAFRSLLMPSAKSDFILEEFDENGKRL